MQDVLYLHDVLETLTAPSSAPRILVFLFFAYVYLRDTTRSNPFCSSSNSLFTTAHIRCDELFVIHLSIVVSISNSMSWYLSFLRAPFGHVLNTICQSTDMCLADLVILIFSSGTLWLVWMHHLRYPSL